MADDVDAWIRDEYRELALMARARGDIVRAGQLMRRAIVPVPRQPQGRILRFVQRVARLQSRIDGLERG